MCLWSIAPAWSCPLNRAVYSSQHSVWSVYKCLEWIVLQVPFIHSRHNTKDRSLGVGRFGVKSLYLFRVQVLSIQIAEQWNLADCVPMYLITGTNECVHSNNTGDITRHQWCRPHQCRWMSTCWRTTKVNARAQTRTCSEIRMSVCSLYTLCSEKNTHSHFLSYLQIAANILMTSLWRHICKRL